MTRLGGLSFAVEPESALSPAERRSLERVGDTSRAAGGPAPFRLFLSADPVGTDHALASFPERTPALVEWSDGRVRLSHRDFDSELDPVAGTGRLYRRTAESFPLEVTLRAALASRLPLEGGLPLHAAGLVIRGQGVAFFGPSGAGKSTLAGLSPYPVLSDELLAVVSGRPFDLMTTGFWGTLGAGNAPPGAFALRALIELGRGPRFELAPLSRAEALRRLIGVIMVPVGPPLWSAALAVAGRLTREVPTFRMIWSPSAPPWKSLEDELFGPE